MRTGRIRFGIFWALLLPTSPVKSIVRGQMRHWQVPNLLLNFLGLLAPNTGFVTLLAGRRMAPCCGGFVHR